MKQTLKAFILYRQYEWEDEPKYCIAGMDYSTSDPAYALVGQMDVEAEIPDNFDPRPQQVAALRSKKKEVQAELHEKIVQLDEQINKLLALPSA